MTRLRFGAHQQTLRTGSRLGRAAQPETRGAQGYRSFGYVGRLLTLLAAREMSVAERSGFGDDSPTKDRSQPLR